MELKSRNKSKDRVTGKLLIEPYGIEMCRSCLPRCHRWRLLIEPYGIEIRGADRIGDVYIAPFNRTLWN